MDEYNSDPTIPIRVVVTPTLLIPAYRVKRKKVRDWKYRVALLGIIFSWILLTAITAFLVYAILMSGKAMH